MVTVLRVRNGVRQEADYAAELAALGIDGVATRVAVIQALIPLALEAVAVELQQDVLALAGPRYARGQRTPSVHRWTMQRGSVYLGDQKLPIRRPRVRNRQTGQEIPLPTYHHLQQPRATDEGVLRRILHGLSCRDYRACAEAVPAAFGLSASTISRRYIRASARKLQTFFERRLDGSDIVALVLDGKVFHDATLVTALGITTQWEKLLLGLVETATENATACGEFLRSLLARGLHVDQGVLVVVDGGKGLPTAVHQVFEPETPIQRCVWHKRENVVAHLPKTQHALWQRKLQHAYLQPTYAEAKNALGKLRQALVRLNESAARSLTEGLEETLTLHRLDVGPTLRRSLATTNGLESIFAVVEQWTGKVDRWHHSNQKQRWLAAALLDLEPRLRRLRGYRELRHLREAIQHERERIRLAAKSIA